MAAAVAASSSGAGAGAKNPKMMQALVEGLNVMRTEQRQLSAKLVEIEGDLNEHRLVIEALKAVSDERKCFRMIGGVLIEQKVKDVIPDLEKNYDLIQKTVEAYQSKVLEKGTAIQEYVKANNLMGLIRGSEGGASSSDGKSDSAAESKSGAGSVLV